MAHVAKFSRAQTGHMFEHYDRSKDEKKLGRHIDKEKTRLNYNLAAKIQPLSQMDFLHARLAAVHCQKRADLKVFADWVITAPKDLPKDEQKDFFEASFEFLAGKYGQKNVISAWVHMDEAQPHMHFAFVPVVHNTKRYKNGDVVERDKVCMKEVINRSALQKFHPELQEYVERALGHPVSILNEATKEGNKTIAELRRETLPERLRSAETMTKLARDKLTAAEAEYRTRTEYARRSWQTADAANDTPFRVKKRYGMNLGGLYCNEFVEVPKHVWESWRTSSAELSNIIAARTQIEGYISDFSQSVGGQKLASVQAELALKDKENARLREENTMLAQRCHLIEQSFKQGVELALEKQKRQFLSLPPGDLLALGLKFRTQEAQASNQRNRNKDYDRGFER